MNLSKPVITFEEWHYNQKIQKAYLAKEEREIKKENKKSRAKKNHVKPSTTSSPIAKNDGEDYAIPLSALEDTPRQLIDEFLLAIQGEGPLAEENWIRYRWMLRNLPVPLFAIVGGRDGLAPLSVTQAIKKWGPKKHLTYLEVEEASHAELIVSTTAQKEILPAISQWIAKL